MILSIAALTLVKVLNADNLKYPSPAKPNPLPGVPTTFALSKRKSKKSHEVI